MALRIGFVGTGGIARYCHLPRLKKLAGVKIGALCDLDEGALQKAAKKFGGSTYTDYRRMLKNEDLDAIWVTVPPGRRGKLEIDIASDGIPMFIEKPVALDVRTADRIANAVEKHKVLTSVGYMYRYDTLVERARKLLDENVLASMSAYYHCPLIPAKWWWLRKNSGGQGVEQLTLFFDLARYLVGEIDAVCAFGSYQVHGRLKNYDIEDTTAVSLHFKSGAVGSFTYGCTSPDWSCSVELIGDRLHLKLDFTQSHMTVNNGKVRTVKASGDNYLKEDKAFLAAVRSGNRKLIRCDFAEAVRSLQVSLAVGNSIKSGKVVKM